MNLPMFLSKIKPSVGDSSVDIRARTENDADVSAGGGEGHINVSFEASFSEQLLPIMKRSISVARVSNLTFTTESPKELIRFKLGLLIKMHTRHLEEKSRYLLEDGRRFEGQHAQWMLREWCVRSKERVQVMRMWMRRVGMRGRDVMVMRRRRVMVVNDAGCC